MNTDLQIEPRAASADGDRRAKLTYAGFLRWTLHSASRPLTLVAGILAAMPLIGFACYVWLDVGLNESVTLGGAFISGAPLSYAIAAGWGAWLGYREKKLGLDQMTALSVFPSDRSRLAALCGTSLTFVLATAVSGILLNVGMFIAPHRVGTVGAAALLSTGVMVALFVPLGYVAGRLLPHLLVIPLVTIAGWLVPSMFGGGQGTPVSMLLPATSPGGSTFDYWNGVILWGQVVWFAGMWCVLVAALVFRRGSRLPMLLGAIGAVACLGGWAIVAHLQYARFESTVVNGLVVAHERCAGSSPAICMHPAFEGLRPELADTFTSLMQKLSGTPGYADEIEQRPRGIGQEPPSGVRAFFLDYARPTDSHLARGEYVESLLDPTACYGADTSASLPWSSIVYQWLTDSLSDTASDAEYAGAQDPSERKKVREGFAALNESERREWFIAHYDKFATCTLGASDFEGK